MQSVFQYKRFGKTVKQQYDRDLSRANALKNGNQGRFVSSQSSVKGHANVSSDDLERVPDLEKPEQAFQHDPRSDEQLDQSSDAGEAQVSETHKDQDEQPEVEILRSELSEGPENLLKQEEAAMSHAATIRTGQDTETALGLTLTGIEVRDRRTNERGKNDKVEKVFVVSYESEKDMMNPHNWSKVTRVAATLNVAAIGWVVGFASAVDSAVLQQASAEFGVSDVAESLATGLFLIGFGVGALVAGPISEAVGRNPVYIATLTFYMVFIMASGLAPNIGAQVTFRFIAGCFASTPLTCAGGSISDLWNPLERVYAFPVFANAAFIGPIFGPVVGGFIGESSLVSWRWTEWITLIISGLVLASVVFFQPETYAPILLKWKAEKLRRLTGNERYKAEIEIREQSFGRRIVRSLYRPLLLTFSEPIIMLVALYLSVIYIILFTFLDGYTFIFSKTYGFSEGITGLSFIGIGIGICLSSLLVPWLYHSAENELSKVREQGGSRLRPEFRLWNAMLGAPAIPVSLFWMGWTTYSSISFWSPLASSVLFGYGILCVFISSYQYVIDSYESYAASALAGVTLVRYVAAGGMVEVAIPMYKNLGIHWTLTVLACLSALMVPVPYLFYSLGPRIRRRSKYEVI